MTLTELKEKWEELFIRFNTSPKLYLKIDFLKLLKFLRNIITHRTGIVESDLKTINGESLVGDGNIEIKEQVLSAGNALEINEDEVISVISHEYNEESNSCNFGKDNENTSLNSVTFGSNNQIIDILPEGLIEFIGYSHINEHLERLIKENRELYELDPYAFYLSNNDYSFDEEELEFYLGSNEDTMFQYSLQLETGEIYHDDTPIDDIDNFIGSKIYLDDEELIYLGKVINAARCTSEDFHDKRIYFSVDNLDISYFINFDSTDSTVRSIWRKSPAIETENSIAEGAYTTARGRLSHASGYETEALGDNSHSEGSYTVSTGEASHAEGYYTSAYGSYSHAEGEGGNISLFKSATEGDELDGFDFTTMSSDSDSDSAVKFFAGSDFYSDSDIDGILNVYGVEKQNKLAGWIGRPIYKADGSLLAIITDINGSHISVDRHVNVTINQPIYIKTGSTGEDAHAEGYLSDASGTHSHAEGERTLATGTNAHSEGYHSKAFGMNSHAEGDTTLALAASSHAEGRKTHTEGEYSHAEGYDTKASGMYSHAEGVRSDAEEEGSHAEGRNTSANGRYAHAEGYNSNAHGDYSHAEGNNTHTEFIGAHAEGYETDAHKDYSHAEGWKTITEGTASHAEGVETQAYGHYSHAEGIKTQTNNDGEHALGKYNISHRNSDIFGNPGNTIFSIGIGNEDRQNAIEIMLNGDIYIKNLAGFNGEDLNNADTLLRHITSSFIVIAAALNDLNNRINELSES